METIVMAQKPE